MLPHDGKQDLANRSILGTGQPVPLEKHLPPGDRHDARLDHSFDGYLVRRNRHARHGIGHDIDLIAELKTGQGGKGDGRLSPEAGQKQAVLFKRPHLTNEFRVIPAVYVLTPDFRRLGKEIAQQRLRLPMKSFRGQAAEQDWHAAGFSDLTQGKCVRRQLVTDGDR